MKLQARNEAIIATGKPPPEPDRWHWLRHRFTEWFTDNEGNIERREDHTSIGRFVEQSRRCVTCGLVQLRTERTTILTGRVK